eukprot:2853893-Ditylum_brightwellii.AAC.1
MKNENKAEADKRQAKKETPKKKAKRRTSRRTSLSDDEREKLDKQAEIKRAVKDRAFKEKELEKLQL